MKYKNHIRTLAVFYGNKYIFLQFQTSKKKKKEEKTVIKQCVYRVLQ